MQLVDLYENDCIFDKFDCCLSGDGQHVATGSYNNLFRVFGVDDSADLILEASRDPQRRRLQAQARVCTPPLVAPASSFVSAAVVCLCTVLLLLLRAAGSCRLPYCFGSCNGTISSCIPG